jgi:predicted permease
MRSRFILLIACFYFSSAFTAPTLHRRIERRIGENIHDKKFSVARVTNGRLALTLNASLNPVVVKASLSATAQLLSALGIGGILAKRNILDKNAVKALSKLTYHIFQPTFLFVSVARTLRSVSDAQKPSLWIMPIAGVVQIAIGASLALVTSRFFRDDTTRRHVQMCTTFANAGPLPLIFSAALLEGSPLAGMAAAAVSFYLLAWSPLFWTFGKIILSGPSSTENGASKLPLQKVASGVKQFLSPPVIGSLIGMLLGSVPRLGNLFFGGLLQPVTGACQTLGTAYLPAVMLVLAGSLVLPQDDSESSTATLSKPASPWPFVTLFATRFMVMPLLAHTMCRLLIGAGLLGEHSSRSAIFHFILLLQGCTPPAQNAVVLLQLAGLPAQGMAKLLTGLYVASVVPMTLLLSWCLSTSGVLAFL